MWDLLWTKWHWDRFFLEYFGFSLLYYTENGKKLIIFTIGLQNKP
jgi:hypothetical protein